MIKPMPWVGRTFSFGLPVGAFPMVVERLRGTPARAAELVNGLPEALLAERYEGGWSVKEHVGHLADLDELDQRRLDEFRARAPVLSAADMENRKTEDAEHGKRPIWIVLDQLREDRAALVDRLDALRPEEIERTAQHPRLQMTLRLIDWAQFVAEHDDHHLAHARWVLASLREVGPGVPSRVRAAAERPH
jgi:hypothetical protein